MEWAYTVRKGPSIAVVLERERVHSSLSDQQIETMATYGTYGNRSNKQIETEKGTSRG